MKITSILAGIFLLALSGAASAQPSPETVNGSASDSGSGWVAGVHTGYNWQNGALVYGVETDINWSNLQSDIRKNFSTPLSPSPSARTSAEVDWFGTLRGRLGWTNGPVLFYATGGLAYGKVNLDSVFNLAQDVGISIRSNTSSTKTGWVLGAGLNYLWGPNTILNLNYQYVDLGKVHLSDSVATGPFGLSQSATARAAFHEVTVGLSWKFPGDVNGAARSVAPWEGWYAGGQVGGAWGLDTDARYSSVEFQSDIRLKRDIALVGRRADGLGIYRYRYLWSDTVYVGVMAQEVALIRPDAVVHSPFDDYLRVNYSKLGMRMVALPN